MPNVLRSQCSCRRAALLMMMLGLANGAESATPAAAAATAACTPPHLRGPAGQRIDGARYGLSWRPLVPLRAGEFLSFEVTVCANAGQPRPSTVRIEAQHELQGVSLRHRPSVRPQGPERFLVEGVLFDPAGRWTLRFDVNSGVEREGLVATIMAP